VALARAVSDRVAAMAPLTVLCPPSIWLTQVAAATDTRLGVGAQTMAAEERGAFTGEISPLMLEGTAGWVILGHSERRQDFGETDEAVGRKVASAVAHGLRPIAAIGERMDQREAGETHTVCEQQLRAALADLVAARPLRGSGLAIAYEPIWAIGTGNAAMGHDAQDVAARIRDVLAEHDPDAAEEIPILYGGSVTRENAREFFWQPDIDGALVGGASLDVDGFGGIVAVADELSR
jgi:triosephosphate isomerase